MQKLTYTGWRGRKITRDINTVIDITKFKDTMGYALLFIAANPSLSVSEIRECLRMEQEELEEASVKDTAHERGRNWIARRRKLFLPVSVLNGPPRENGANADGKDLEACRIMRDYPTASIRNLVDVLKDNGIRRGREWVRTHRGLTVD